MKVIFHIDMNSFFASCHQVANPHFQGKPLVVANSSRRAVVTTVNYEARQLGINSPMPLYKALVCIILTKLKWLQLIDVTDIYLKYGSTMQLALDMQQNVFQQVVLPNSIGISYNRLLA